MNLLVTAVMFILAVVSGVDAAFPSAPVNASDTPALDSTTSHPYDSIATYDRTLFVQQDPKSCDLILQGDADGKTWVHGCYTNGCNPGVEDCIQVEVIAGVACSCSLGRAKCWTVAVLDAGGQVTGVICHRNGCSAECDLGLWVLGKFYACWC